jgi:aminocarboxymuconate-semialdehyde decarboxylase
MKHPPSEYLRRIYFDSIVFRPDILQGLINRAGIGQVVVGTDYPFDMGDYDLDALLGGVPGLDEKGLMAIRSGNARRLLNL